MISVTSGGQKKKYPYCYTIGSIRAAEGNADSVLSALFIHNRSKHPYQSHTQTKITTTGTVPAKTKGAKQKSPQQKSCEADKREKPG